MDVWALTDHDEIGGLAEAAGAARELGMRFATGVEISVTWAGLTVHVVGLRFDPSNVALAEGLRKTRAGRAERAKRIGERLAGMGMPGAYEGALPFAGNPELISRTLRPLPGRGRLLPGCADRLQQVPGRRLRRPRADAMGHACRAVGWIRGAGGRRHRAPGPLQYTPLQFAALFDEFIELGGEGIEVNTGSHTADEARKYADVARRYGFLASRGSDFHSPTESRMDLGRLPALPPDLKPVWHDWF